MISNLSDIISSRGIEKIYYFHTDHFEPWSKNIQDDSCRAVERFYSQTKKNKFGRKQSLFYLAYMPATLKNSKPFNGFALEGDEIVFLNRDKAIVDKAKNVLAPLEAEGEHKFEMHIHHERWTQNSGLYDPILNGWLNDFSSAELDSARLNLAIQVAKKFMSYELGREFDSWAFVHGNWALNASDRSICTVNDELKILMDNGCWGDFTFPAGRMHCDPKILEEPYFCDPICGEKSYDSHLSNPLPVGLKQSESDDNRFFIWNSKIKHNRCSLDYYSESNRALFKNPELVIESWLRDSYVNNKALFIKTHAHSLKWEYEMHKIDSVIPHSYPDVVKIFDVLERVADLANVPIEQILVDEVRKILCPNILIKPKIISKNPATEKQIPIYEISGGQTSPRFSLEKNNCFIFNFNNTPFAKQLFDQCDSSETPFRSSLRLLENGIEIGTPHSVHDVIRN